MKTSARDLARLSFNYPEVGYTAILASRGETTERMARYRVVDVRRRIGTGPSSYVRASKSLLSLDVHRAAGLTVSPPGTQVREGANLILSYGVAFLRVDAPCRIVYTVEGDRSVSFAYGALNGHPESGEARFEVSIIESEAVWLSILSFSAPVWTLARVAGPFVRSIQDSINRRYVAAAVSVAAGQDHGG